MGHKPSLYREETPAHERRIFTKFRAVRGVSPRNITQPNPPDIVADFGGSESVAYELVRLNRSEELHDASLMRDAPAFLLRHFSLLSPDEHARLSSKYADAHVLLRFAPGTDPAQRRRCLPFAWTLLDNAAPGFKGTLHHSYAWPTTCEPHHLKMIYVSRLSGSTGGPGFHTLDGASAYPIEIQRVVDKLRKPYVCAEPLELLAYTANIDIAFASDMTAIAEAVRVNLPGSAFRRVWAFDELANTAHMVGEL